MQIEQLKSLLDILLAAAAADGHTDAKEKAVIRKVLDEMGMEDPAMRTELEGHQWNFELASFDLSESVHGLGELSMEERRIVLRLLERVEEADGVIDLEEENFIREVAKALGLEGEELEALTLQIVETTPPPLPKGEKP